MKESSANQERKECARTEQCKLKHPNLKWQVKKQNESKVNLLKRHIVEQKLSISETASQLLEKVYMTWKQTRADHISLCQVLKKMKVWRT